MRIVEFQSFSARIATVARIVWIPAGVNLFSQLARRLSSDRETTSGLKPSDRLDVECGSSNQLQILHTCRRKWFCLRLWQHLPSDVEAATIHHLLWRKISAFSRTLKKLPLVTYAPEAPNLLTEQPSSYPGLEMVRQRKAQVGRHCTLPRSFYATQSVKSHRNVDETQHKIGWTVQVHLCKRGSGGVQEVGTLSMSKHFEENPRVMAHLPHDCQWGYQAPSSSICIIIEHSPLFPQHVNIIEQGAFLNPQIISRTHAKNPHAFSIWLSGSHTSPLGFRHSLFTCFTIFHPVQKHVSLQHKNIPRDANTFRPQANCTDKGNDGKELSPWEERVSDTSARYLCEATNVHTICKAGGGNSEGPLSLVQQIFLERTEQFRGFLGVHEWMIGRVTRKC